MAKLLDEIIVIDVESTCWEAEPPRGETSEIIQIGVCRLDVQRLERLEKRSIFVNPARSQVSAFCTQLTTILPSDVSAAGSLADACRILKQEFRTPQRLWASYGDYDRRQFERNGSDLGVAYPFGPSHLNVKALFAAVVGLSTEVGMAEALKLLGLPLEGTHHRGDDDAWNIAGILARLLERGRDVSMRSTD